MRANGGHDTDAPLPSAHETISAIGTDLKQISRGVGHTLFSACYNDTRAGAGGWADDMEFRLEDETFEDTGSHVFDHMTFESLVLFAKMKLLTDHIGDWSYAGFKGLIVKERKFESLQNDVKAFTEKITFQTTISQAVNDDKLDSEILDVILDE